MQSTSLAVPGEALVVYVLGMTASSKSASARDLAWPFGGQIVNIDRHALVQDMDIGTATPDAFDRKRVTHRLINYMPFADAEVPPSRLAHIATQAVNHVLESSPPGVPFVVGGSLRLAEEMIYGSVSDAPDPAFLRKLRHMPEGQLLSYVRDMGYGLPFLPEDLPSLRKKQKIIDHIVYRKYTRRRRTLPASGVLVLGIDKSEDEIHKAIEQRTVRMMQSGLLDEVKRLLHVNGGEWTDFMRDTIGYRELEAYFAGTRTLATATAMIIDDTKRYARWQREAFIRHIPHINWVRDLTAAQQTLAAHMQTVARRPAHQAWRQQRDAMLRSLPKPALTRTLARGYAYGLTQPKAIVFDIGGTLFPEESWLRLTTDLGASATEHRRIYQEYKNRVIDYEQAKGELLKLWQATGNANRTAIEQIFNSWELDPGASKIVEAANRDYPVCLISGSMDLYVQIVAQKLGITHWYANTVLHWDADGNLIDVDYDLLRAEKKLQQFGAFCRAYDLEPQDCLVVGGETDLGLFALSRRGVLMGADHPEEYIHQAWKTAATAEELPTILKSVG